MKKATLQHRTDWNWIWGVLKSIFKLNARKIFIRCFKLSVFVFRSIMEVNGKINHDIMNFELNRAPIPHPEIEWFKLQASKAPLHRHLQAAPI